MASASCLPLIARRSACGRGCTAARGTGADRPGVHESAEREQRPERPGDDRVDLVDDVGALDGLDVRLEDEERPPPQRHRVAVVVGLLREEVVTDRHPDPHHDQDRQQQVDEQVGSRRRAADPHVRGSPVDEADEADDADDAGHRAGDRREPAVGALGHADGLGEGLGDQQADHVPTDGCERAVMERGAGPAEDLVFEDLGGAAGPAELVGPVAPPGADGEGRDRDVRKDDPQQDLAGAHGRAPVGIASGGP